MGFRLRRFGAASAGPATIQTETLPDGKTVVASIELLNTTTVYSFSRDHAGVSYCTGACAVIWIPVLTTGRPHVAGGVAAKDVGVIRRADGTNQVTYDGKPLYLYSAEKVNVTIDRHRRQWQRARRSQGRYFLRRCPRLALRGSPAPALAEPVRTANYLREARAASRTSVGLELSSPRCRTIRAAGPERLMAATGSPRLPLMAAATQATPASCSSSQMA